jgi:predicted aldo/keto reductase-like oxidoreductase
MYQHPSDWHNSTGVIRQAKEQEMGVILMRPLTSGVFQRLMAEAFPEIDAVSRDGWTWGGCCSTMCSRTRTWT